MGGSFSIDRTSHCPLFRLRHSERCQKTWVTVVHLHQMVRLRLKPRETVPRQLAKRLGDRPRLSVVVSSDKHGVLGRPSSGTLGEKPKKLFPSLIGDRPVRIHYLNENDLYFWSCHVYKNYIRE